MFRKLPALGLCISLLFFLFTPFTRAETLTLDQPLAYAGLTFSQPLTFSQQAALSPRSLVFGEQERTQTLPTEKPLTLLLQTPTTPLEQTVLLAAVETEPTETPTPTPTVTPTLTPTPTTILTPTPPPAGEPLPTLTPTSIPVTATLSTPGGLNADKLFGMVNAYRASKGLPAFQKDDKSCQLAASRAPEVANEVATGTMHQGLKNRNLPYWNTENIISYNSEEGAFNWWLNDQIHKEAIEGNYTYSCLACSGNSCAEEFTNYQLK